MLHQARATTTRALLPAALSLLVLPAVASRAAAQTDYYNTDAGRPISVEDAYPVERRAVELQIAPLRLDRTGGVYGWGIEPEIAVGILPRTQLEVAFPLAYVDLGAGRRRTGLAGVEVGALHNLNVETRIPALAVAAELLIPAGGLGPDELRPSLKAIATKTFPWARVHVNGTYHFGDRSVDDPVDAGGHAASDLASWEAGVAVDRTFPLQSFLLTAELVAGRPVVDGAEVEWSTAAGTRYQLSPRVALDGGAGYRLTGIAEGWYVTFGAALSLGLPWTPRR